MKRSLIPPSPTGEDAPADGLSGLIERVTYHNEETGFAVLKVDVKGRRELITVVGSLPSVTAGEWITAQGKWVQDRDHGMQLKAEYIRCAPPTSLEGIEKYLGSGLIKGIGPVYAKKLVAKFKDKIFDVIENYSQRLQEIDGIGSGRRKQIKDAWAQQKVVRDIMVFLHANGVSTSRAFRIYKTYGEKSIETVRSNPYVLARDIHGIGFKSADVVALKLGIPKDSILRARAGLAHVLLEASGQGHCALPRQHLIDAGIGLLDIDPPIVAEALERLRADREVIEESIGDDILIFPPNLRTAEIIIAETLTQLAKLPSAYPEIDVDKALEWVEGKTGTTLAEGQRDALRKAMQHRVLVITGGPGVGKTTLVNSILKILIAKRVRVLLAAPTGRAAKRLSESTGLEAKTIHRLLEFQPGPTGFARHERNPLEGDLLVVDETSMVDVSLMSKLLRALPKSAHLLLVGDVDQLPSVGPGRVLGDLIESKKIPVSRLTEIFRQAAQSRIITNAHRINEGQMPEMESGADSDFYFIDRETPEQCLETLLELIHKRIPAKKKVNPIRDIQLLTPMNRGLLGVREMNVQLQNVLNPTKPGGITIERFGWQFRSGDKVIQTENNYDKEVFNGDIGFIESIDAEEREVEVLFDGKPVIYDFNELDELSLAYAISIHKSQGSEFPVVVIPLAMQHFMLLQRNLVYTGITRGKRLVMIVGQKKALGMAVRNNDTAHRHSGLLTRLRSI